MQYRDDYNDVTIDGYQAMNGDYYLRLQEDDEPVVSFCCSTHGSQLPKNIWKRIVSLVREMEGMDPIDDWHPVSERPDDIFKPIVYVTVNNKVGTLKSTKSCYNGSKDYFSGWDWYVEKRSIKKWKYQDELI